MKTLTAILLLFSISLSAQNHRFIYELIFVKDSLEKDKTISEDMYLDITEPGSRYYSYEVFESDSLRNAEFEKQARGNNLNINIKDTKKGGVVKTIIYKEYPEFEIIQYENLGGNNYKILDDRKIIWKIEPDKIKIGEFNAQKATTEMYGRKWIAWFSSDLPFQDGPYKFHGLPGLIVKLESEDKSHVMVLKGVKNLPKDFEIKPQEEKYSFSKTVEMDYPKFKKTFQNYLKNPISPMRAMMMSSTMKIEIKDQNGKPLDMNKVMRDNEEKQKEANKKINNILELDLLK